MAIFISKLVGKKPDEDPCRWQSAKTCSTHGQRPPSMSRRSTWWASIYSDPGHVIAYADGEVRQEFSICLKARIVGGVLALAETGVD
jgi:hypothetical protein